MTHVFIDLEDTVINNWYDKQFLYWNNAKIAEYISNQNVSTVNIFSYAIWNDDDIQEFEKELKQPLEYEFGKVITLYPSVQQIAKEALIFDNNKYDNEFDFIATNSKQFGFPKYILSRNKDITEPSKFVLFDDSVFNMVVTANNVTIELIKV